MAFTFPQEGFSVSDINPLYKMCYCVVKIFEGLNKTENKPVPLRLIIDGLIRYMPDDMNITHLTTVRYLLGFGLMADKHGDLYWFAPKGFNPTKTISSIKCSWDKVKNIEIYNADMFVKDLLANGF